MKNKRLALILFLIVLLPLLLLGWQSWKISNDSQKLETVRFTNLIDARLSQVDSLLQSYFEEMQIKWSLLIPQWKIDENTLRDVIENDGNIRQIFVIDVNNQRRFPPKSQETTKAEKQFVNRLEKILQDPQMLFSNQNLIANNIGDVADGFDNSVAMRQQPLSESAKTSSNISTKVAKAKVAPTSSLANIDLTNSEKRQGWFMWHWGSDANLIFWQQTEDKNIVGIEMEPVRIKSDLISRLPDSKLDDSENDFRIRLQDASGQVVYQWGGLPVLDSQTQAQKKYSLSYPLASWSLEYFGEPYYQSSLARYSLLITLLGFALLISALAWFLYREQTREMRLAEQRVQFVSQVSHELKTPLTNIRMYAEMLDDQLENEEQPKRYLSVITDESKRLSRLISNVLNFSRAPRIHKREINPNEVVRQSIEHFKPIFESHNISINQTFNANKTIHTDPDILEQILNNLLSNVEKYASSGKRVNIVTETTDSEFTVIVRDYGKGISRAEQKHIFKPFYRANDEITEGVSGTGIGLTIAKQQATRLGGKLELEEVKQGASFKLTLPI